MSRLLVTLFLVSLTALSGCGKSTDTPAAPAAKAEGEKESGHSDHGEEKEGGHAEGEEGHEEEGHGEEGHGESVKLTPGAREAANLSIAPAAAMLLKEQISLYGVVRPNAERVRSVTARFPGVVREVNVRIGDTVREGAALALVESDESLQEYSVRSPLAGVVTERFTNPGQQASTTPLLTVADLSTVWVELSIYPRDRPRIREGQSVRVRATDGGHNSEGRIVFVSPLGASLTQSLTARVLIDNTDGRWMPGLHVRGDIAVSESKVDIAVPSAALQEVEGKTVVFVEEEGAFEARAVTVGRNDGQWVEILAGLTAGDPVVGEGSFVLKAEIGKGSAEHGH